MFRHLFVTALALSVSLAYAKDIDPAKPTPVEPGKAVPLNPATRPAVTPPKPDAPTSRPSVPVKAPTTAASTEEHFPTPAEIFEKIKSKKADAKLVG